MRRLPQASSFNREKRAVDKTLWIDGGVRVSRANNPLIGRFYFSRIERAEGLLVVLPRVDVRVGLLKPGKLVVEVLLRVDRLDIRGGRFRVIARKQEGLAHCPEKATRQIGLGV